MWDKYKDSFAFNQAIDNKDINLLLSHLISNYGLTFKRKGNYWICSTNKSLRIVNGNEGYYIVDKSNKYENFNSTFQGGYLSVLVYHEGGFTATTTTTTKFTTTTTTKFTTTNSEEKPKHSYKDRYVPDTWNSANGKKVLEYFKNKVGCSKALLDKYGVFPNASIKYENGNQIKAMNWFLWGYKIGEKVKLFCSNEGTKPYPPSGRWCFGFDQLPKSGTGVKVVIVGGESDCLLINNFGNKKNVYAITYGSETAKIPSTDIEYLKENFESVSVLYDHDVPGIRESKRIAKEHDITLIESEKAFCLAENLFTFERFKEKKYNDLCDWFKHTGVEGINNLIDKVIVRFKRAYTDKKDPFFIPHDYIELNVKQYVGEKSYDIIEILKTYPKLIMQGPAGVGKSHLCKDIVSAIGYKKMIFAAPTTSIAEQSCGSFSKHHDCALYIGSSKDSVCDIESAKIVVTTYDQLNKFRKFGNKDTILVIDEFDVLVRARDYREKVVPAWRTTSYFKNVLLLSATPDYHFTLNKNVHSSFGYQLVKVNPAIQNKVALTVVSHKCTKKALLLDIELKKGSKTELIKLDSTKTLSAFDIGLSKRMKSEIIHSQDKAKKENSKVYNSLMDNSKFGCYLDFLLFTSIFENGVSILDEIGAMHILDGMNHAEIIQLANRPRMNIQGGKRINEILNVRLYKTSKSIKKIDKNLNWHIVLNECLDAANNSVNKLNGKNGVTNNATKRLDTDLKHLAVKNESGIYEVDILGVLFNCFKFCIDNTTLEGLLNRVKKLDDRFSFQHENLEAKESEEINQILKGASLDDEQQDNEFRGLLATQYHDVLNAVAYISKDAKLKESIASIMNRRLDKERAKAFIMDNKEALNSKNKNFLVRSIVNLGANIKNISKISNVVSRHDNDTIKKNVSTSIKREREKMYKIGGLSKEEMLNVEKDMIIKGMIDKMIYNSKLGKYKEGIAPDKLAKAVNDKLKKAGLIKRSMTQIKANKQVTSLYEIELKTVKKGKKTVRRYIIDTSKRIKLHKDFDFEK